MGNDPLFIDIRFMLRSAEALAGVWFEEAGFEVIALCDRRSEDPGGAITEAVSSGQVNAAFLAVFNGVHLTS